MEGRVTAVTDVFLTFFMFITIKSRTESSAKSFRENRSGAQVFTVQADFARGKVFL